ECSSRTFRRHRTRHRRRAVLERRRSRTETSGSMSTKHTEPMAPPSVPPSKEERVFLEGPQPRSWEFRTVVRIMREFVRGFRVLHFVGPCVTVFGSARFQPGHEYYELARAVGSGLA